MTEWRDIETCPRHMYVLFYREDAGVFMGQFTSLETFLEEREIEESTLSEAELFEDDFWAFCADGAHRCDGDLKPTHWMPVPLPPPPHT